MRKTLITLTLLPITLALLAACSSGPTGDEDENDAGEGDETESVLTEYEENVSALASLVEAHVAAVDAAADHDEVDTLESAYASDWAAAMEELQHVMDDVYGCEMGDETMDMMEDADGSMMEMDDEVEAHVAAHEGHADLADCLAEEASHSSEMDAHATDLSAHHDHWHDDGDFHCGVHEDH